jgi:subtilisin family serine protease
MRYGRLVAVGLLALAVAGPARPPSAIASPPATRSSDLCAVLSLVLGVDCGTKSAAAAGAEPTADPTQVETAVRQTSPIVRYDPGRLAVTARPGVSRAKMDALFARTRVTLERAIPQIRAYLVKVVPARRAAALASLSDSALVASAEKEPLVEAFAAITPDDESWGQQWGLRLAGFPQAWGVTRGSSRVVVAVLDTGVDPTQPELRGALVPGYDFVNGDADPSDDNGHGTPVAGIIGARGNNRAGMAGICWNCSVMPVKVLGAKGVGLDSVIAAGIVWAVDHGARVLNLSLGGPGASVDLDNAIAYALARNAIVVAAAGNNGTTEVNYPAGNPLAFSVAATNSADRRYSWSNYGSWVRIAAPGCNVAPVRGGREEIFCGTSSATPLVAGLAALAVSANPGATAVEIAEAMQRAAVPVAGVVQYGRIDAARSLSMVAAPATGTRSDAVFRGTIGAGTRTRTFSLPIAAGRVTATLTFRGPRGPALSLFHGDGSRPLAEVWGKSPVRIARDLPSGALRLVVSATRRASFVLRVSYSS